jgi:hypothetical protein
LFEGGHDLQVANGNDLALARIMYHNADIWILMSHVSGPKLKQPSWS